MTPKTQLFQSFSAISSTSAAANDCQQKLFREMTSSTRRSVTKQQQKNVNSFCCLAAIVCGLMMLCLLAISSVTAAPPARYSNAEAAAAFDSFISHIDADPEAYANILNKRSASPFFAWGGKRAAAPAPQAFFHWGGKRAAKAMAAAAANPAANANYYDLWNYYRTYLPFIMEEGSKRAAAPRAAQFFSWGGRR